MCCYVALAEILNRSVVYVKEFDPKRIRIRKKQILPEHVKLWNIILHMFDNMQDNGKITSFEDLTEYIKGSRILSSSVRISDMPCDSLEYTAAVNTDSKALAAMRILVSKIDIMLCSGPCDHERLFVYIRTLHHLPKCFLSVSDRRHISEETALSYMHAELG